MKYFSVLLFAMLILLAACDVEKPVIPKWDIDLTVPLINQKYYVADLVDSVNIFSDENDVVFLKTSGEVTSQEFGVVAFTPPDDAIIQNVQVLQLPDAVPLPLNFADPTEKVQFSYARIATGAIRTRFTQSVPNSYVTVEFENLFNPDNSKIVITANTSLDWITRDLAGCHIGVDGAVDPVTALNFKVKSVSGEANFTPIGHFSIDATSEMKIEELQGRLIDFHLDMDQDNTPGIELDYPENLNESVTLQSATIHLDLDNKLGFAAEFNGQFKATNDEGDEVIIDILDDDGNKFVVYPGLNIYDATNGMSELLSIMPTKIEVINGGFTILNGTEAGSVSADDYIHLDYVVKAPFTFTLHENDIVIQDEVDIPIAKENADKIDQNALGAELTMVILNKVPVGATAIAYFSDQPGIVVTDVNTYDFSEPATIYSSLAPEGAGEQTVTITLDESEIKLFTKPHVYLKWKFTFRPSNGTVTITSSTDDYIQIKGMLDAKLAVEDL